MELLRTFVYRDASLMASAVLPTANGHGGRGILADGFGSNLRIRMDPTDQEGCLEAQGTSYLLGTCTYRLDVIRTALLQQPTSG